jgi:hypothetical protein
MAEFLEWRIAHCKTSKYTGKYRKLHHAMGEGFEPTIPLGDALRHAPYTARRKDKFVTDNLF